MRIHRRRQAKELMELVRFERAERVEIGIMADYSICDMA
jgi:hypothetical protein